jgi:hypothetical protein
MCEEGGLGNTALVIDEICEEGGLGNTVVLQHSPPTGERWGLYSRSRER